MGKTSANYALLFHVYIYTYLSIGNQVTIATRYVTNVYCPKEALCQMWTQYGLKETSY